jgi:hypothetical protein
MGEDDRGSLVRDGLLLNGEIGSRKAMESDTIL